MARNPFPSASSLQDVVFSNPEDPRRSKTRMNLLLVFALVVILVVGTLLTLDIFTTSVHVNFSTLLHYFGCKMDSFKEKANA